MRDPARLRVWQRANALSRQVAGSFSERAAAFAPGLLSQSLSSASAVADYLADACTRPAGDDGLRLLGLAVTTLNELETHLTLAADIGLVSRWRYEELSGECATLRRMTRSLALVIERRMLIDRLTA